MDTVTSPSGVRIHFPATYRVSASGSRGRSPTRGAQMRPSFPGSESDILIDALASQDMQLLDIVELEPVQAPTDPSGQRRRGTSKVPEQQEVSFQLTVAANENAVLLLEQDGVYSWHFPSEIGRASAVTPTRRGRESGPATTGKELTFRVEIFAESTAAQRRDTRGFVDVVYRKVKVFVLKFVADVAVDKVIAVFERKVEQGIVVIQSTDPTEWRLLKDASQLDLPRLRPARILLYRASAFCRQRPMLKSSDKVE